MSILIPLSKPAAANISRAEVVVSGAGMSEMRQDLTVSGTAITGTVRSIPAGTNRTFTINCYNSAGALTYTGSSTTTVTAGQEVRVPITVRSTTSPGAGPVVLEVVSPVAADYTYGSITGSLEISGEVRNPSNDTASSVSVTFTARNAAGAVMDQGTKSLGSVPPGRKFFTFRFSREVFASRAAPAARVDYEISHSLGGPDSGSVSLSGG